MQDLTEAMKRIIEIRKDLEAILTNFPGLYDEFIRSLDKGESSSDLPRLIDYTVNELRNIYEATDQEILDWFLRQNPDSTRRAILDNTGIKKSKLDKLLLMKLEGRCCYHSRSHKGLPETWRSSGFREIKYGKKFITVDQGDPIDADVPAPTKNKSNRDLVREAGANPSNIQQLAEKSGLTKAQVRGVINAPDERDDWEREDDDSGLFEVLYSYRPPDRTIRTSSGVVKVYEQK